jgi:O-antigen/teichoic acid export membrane protein
MATEATTIQTVTQVIAPPLPRLRHSFAWTLAGNVIYAGSQWAMLIVLAKFGTPVLVGQFALGLAVTAPVFSLLNLQLRDIQATDANSRFAFSEYLGLRLTLLLLAPVPLTIVVFAGGYTGTNVLIIAILSIAKTFESISDVFYGLFQQSELLKRISISMMAKGSLSLFALSSAVYCTRSALWGATALATAWAAILVVYDIPNGRRIRALARYDSRKTPFLPRLNARRLLRLAWLALPLGLVMALTSLTVSIPRYFVEHYSGDRGLGIFASLVYLQVPGLTAMRALAHAVLPRLSKYYWLGEYRAFRTLVLQVLALGGLMGLAGVAVAMIAGRRILLVLYGPEYAVHSDVLVLVMFGAALGYLAGLLYYAMIAVRQLLAQIPLLVLVTLSTTTLCLLMPADALWAGATALLVAWTVQALGSLALLQRALKQARATLDQPVLSNEICLDPAPTAKGH